MNVKWILVMAVVVHLVWGVLLLIAGEPVMWITAVHETSQLVPSTWVLGLIYIAAGLAGGFALWRHDKLNPALGVWMIIPQQLLLMKSASGAIICILRSQFADGVDRPWAFIAADQSPAIIMAVLHTFALIDQFSPHLWKWRPKWTTRR